MPRQPFVNPVIADLIYQAVSGVAGVQFTGSALCPICQGLLISHDMKKRRFSTVFQDDKLQHIYVYIKRFHCRECDRLCYSPSPFYDKSRFGSPIVDLCLTLSRNHTYSYAALLMNRVGIVIDRGTVRKTVITYNHEVASTDFLGLLIPQSVLALSTLVTTADPGIPISGSDVLAACGLNIKENL